MKVLHVIPSISSVHGGPSSAIFGMTQALLGQGISVDIVTTNDDGKRILDVPIGEKHTYSGVPCFFCRRIPYFRQYALSSDMAQWLWKNIEKYDLLHVHSVFSYSSTVAMVIARHQNIPYFVRPLGQLCHWSLKQSKFPKSTYLNLLGFRNLNAAKAIHFTALQEEHEVNCLNLRPESFIIPLGVESQESFDDPSNQLRDWLKIPKDLPILLFLSRIHSKKGLDYLVPALAEISKIFPFHFVVAGDGMEEDVTKLTQLLKECELLNRTHLLGFVEGRQKELLLQGADLFILTSHSENFGVAVIEAMNAALPVLITPGVAISDVVRRHDLGYVPTLDHSSICQSILHFMRNPMQAKKKGQRGKVFAQNNYDWDVIATQTVKVYQDILN